nr:uncharacterized protein LOC112936062 isoform X1 [Oryza sativa Japonica Group]
MALSPAASHDQSIAQSSAPATPSVDISDTNVGATSLRITGSQDQNIDLECASKTPAQTAEEDEYDQDGDDLPLSQMCTGVATKTSTSKAYKKRPRPSPVTGAAKKLFKDTDDEGAGGSRSTRA